MVLGTVFVLFQHKSVKAGDIRNVCRRQAILTFPNIGGNTFLARDGAERANKSLLLPNPLMGVPIRGTVARTGLIETSIDAEIEYLNFSHLLENPNYFALRVRGHGMTGALIDDDDIVIMRPLAEPKTLKNGEIVAACVDRKTTLSYFHLKGNKVILQPANPDRNLYPSTEVSADSVKIQGVLVAVWRGYYR